MLSKYIGGRDIRRAIDNVRRLPYAPIFDWAREGAADKADALSYAAQLRRDVAHAEFRFHTEKIPTYSFAIKASSFGHDADAVERMVEFMVAHHVPRVLLDAERHEAHAFERALYERLAKRFHRGPSNVPVVYKTFQMYRRDALDELAGDVERHHAAGIPLGVKLVRGAYLHQDRASGALYERKEDTDRSFDEGARLVMARQHMANAFAAPGCHIRLLLATHNDASIAAAIERMDKYRFGRKYVHFAQLLGMNDRASRRLHEDGYVVHKYVPYGGLRDAYPYLLRRLYENVGMLRHL